MWFPIGSFASSQVFLFGTVKEEFWNFKKARLLVSRHCVSDEKLADCKARGALKKISFKKLDRTLFGGTNPGGLICTQQIGGYVMVGVNAQTKNENSFCRLPDGSIVDNGSLVYYAIQNDKSKRPKQ